MTEKEFSKLIRTNILGEFYDSNFHIEENIAVLNDLLMEEGYYPM